jgi:hypothetical protein
VTNETWTVPLLSEVTVSSSSHTTLEFVLRSVSLFSVVSRARVARRTNVAREFEFDSLRQRVLSFRGSLISRVKNPHLAGI